MAANISKALVGIGTISAGIASYAYWVNGKTKDLSDLQKGTFFPRMGEVTNAFLQSQKIQDRYTANHHVDLVASLSSRQFTVKVASSPEEFEALNRSYAAGYVPEPLRKNPKTTPSIFQYDANVRENLSTLPPDAREGYAFSGFITKIHLPQARESILKGDYVRCKLNLDAEDQSKTDSPKFKNVDVIITGTTDPKKCSSFQQARDSFLKGGFVRYIADLELAGSSETQPMKYKNVDVIDIRVPNPK